jgi:hypothetical protein
VVFHSYVSLPEGKEIPLFWNVQVVNNWWNPSNPETNETHLDHFV